MPFQGEHAARILDPGKFKKFRRLKDEFGSGIDVIYGLSDDGKSATEQSIRFDSDKFTVAKAKKWLRDHDCKPLAFEEAKPITASLDLPDSVSDVSLAFRSDDWTFAPVSAKRVESGQPVQRFRKELVRVGKYVKDSDNIRFEITQSLLAHWVATYHQMIDNGVKVPIPNTHKGKGDPDENRGYVTDMFVDGDALVMTCDLIGEDAIKAAARCDVSIESPREFVDGLGNRYARPIVNVALCTEPVVPGLGEFVPIAASLRSSEMDWKNIGKSLGIKDKLTDANAEEKIVGAFKASTTLVLSHVSKALGTGDDVTVESLPGRVEKLIETKSAEAVAKAKDKTREVDPVLITLSRENGQGKLTNLAAAGFVTPATVKRLEETYLTDDALKLSLGNGKGTGDFDKVIEILRGNDPVELKAERSKGQTKLKLDDPLDSSENIMLATCERRAKEEAERQNRTLVTAR